LDEVVDTVGFAGQVDAEPERVIIIALTWKAPASGLLADFGVEDRMIKIDHAGDALQIGDFDRGSTPAAFDVHAIEATQFDVGKKLGLHPLIDAGRKEGITIGGEADIHAGSPAVGLADRHDKDRLAIELPAGYDDGWANLVA
jgi:hypothetical protein